MRLVLHNPHIYWFKPSIADVIRGVSAPNKYEYIFDFLYQRKDLTVFIDDSFSLTTYSPMKEFDLWIKVNHLDPRRFVTLRNFEELRDDDVFFSFFYQNMTNVSGRFDVPRDRIIGGMRTSKAYSVLHLSHYGYNTGLGSENAFAAGADLLVSENNLARNSDFFRKHFPWYGKDVYVLPFVPKRRFVCEKPFSERKNKALATGTITYPIDDESFTGFFGHGMLQPMRHTIYEQASGLTQYLDSMIGHITDGEKKAAIPVGDIGWKRKARDILKERLKKSRALKLAKDIVLAPVWLFKSIRGRVKQSIEINNAIKAGANSKARNDRAYYQADIVKLYNEYKMFVVPEEVIDLPGIGFIEGMACGSAYIGLRDPMYSDIGMIEGENYIAYDGTLKDLSEKIAYYQEHGAELERIADAGCRFAREKVSPEAVMTDFLSFLEGQVKRRPVQ